MKVSDALLRESVIGSRTLTDQTADTERDSRPRQREPCDRSRVP